MNNMNAKENLKKRVHEKWDETKRPLRDNIIRGHTRSISSDIEDSVALFVSSILGDGFEIYIDPSISFDNKTHRPDLLVVKDGVVKACIELKSNMGWCRDASSVIDKIKSINNAFCEKERLVCKFSNAEAKEVQYTNEVKLFLVALSARNGGKKDQINKNYEYAKREGVDFFLLFDGWYGDLVDRDVESFAKELVSIKGQHNR